MEQDRTETNDLAQRYPDLVEDFAAQYQAWASRCSVIPREKILEMLKQQPTRAFWEDE